MQEDSRERQTGEGRRSFLKKVGVGAAAAWTAPVLLSSAASAGPGTQLPFCVTFGTTVLNRADAGTVTTGVLPIGAYPLTTTPGSTLVTIALADPTGAYLSGGGFPSGIDNIFPRAGEIASLHTQMGVLGAGPITITLTFSAAVTGVSFDVLDVDLAGGSGWIDNINVTANGGTIVGSPGPSVSTIVANQQYQGSNVVANGSNLADVGFSFTGPLTTITVLYSRAGAILGQGIGISSICYTE